MNEKQTTLIKMNYEEVSEHIDSVLQILDSRSLTPHQAYAVICLSKVAMEKVLGISDSGIVGYESEQ